MKNLTYGLIGLLLSLFAVEACTKVGLPATNGQLGATKTSLYVNNLDTLGVIGAATTDSTTWSVAPAGFDTIAVHHNASVIKFTKAGVYTVTAIVNGTKTLTIAITVTDIPAGQAPVHLSLANEQITLLSNLYKSKIGDTTYIYFTAETTNHYLCSNSVINYSNSLTASNNFGLNFIDVTQPVASGCRVSNGSIGSSIIAFWQNASNPYMVNGTYPLAVTLGGTTYTGSITIAATTVTFNWTYTAGVTIVPKVINR